MSKLDSENLPESPSAMLAAMALEAPAPIANFIEQQCMIVLATEMPKLYAVSQMGPARDVTDIQPLATIFANAMVTLDKDSPEETKQLTATVRDAATQLAELLDKSVKRILLDDKVANRLALMDMSSCHARLVKILADVALTPEQLAQVEEAEANAA